MKTNQPYLLKLALTVTLSLSAAFGDLVAATWKGATGASGTNFNVNANWDTLPGAGAALVFGTNAADSDTLNNDFTGASFANITFNNGAPAYIIRGNAFTWNNNSTLANNSGVLQTIATNITAPAGAATYTVNGNANVALTGIISTSSGALTIQNQLNAGGTLTLGGANVSSGGFTYQANKNGLTTVIGDIYAEGGLSLSSVSRASMVTVWLTGSNQFVGSRLKGSLGPMELYLDYRNSNHGKLTGITEGFDMYGTVIHLLGGSTIEQVGFFNSGAYYRASVLIDRGGTTGSSAIISSNIFFDAATLYDLGDSALFGSSNANAGNTNDITSARITIGANNGAGRDFAFRDDEDNLYYAYQGYTALGSANTANALVSGGTAISAAVTANSLKITAANGGHLDLNGNTLTLTSGGLLYTGTGDYTIGGDSGVAGVINTGNTDLIIWQSGAGALTVNADLTHQGIRVAGGGALTLNGVSSGVGSTIIDIDNYVRLGADQAIASGNLYMSMSSTLELNGHNQKVASLLGGNSNIGFGTITNSDLINTSTLTIGALDGPATSGASGLASLILSGNIHLVFSGALTTANTSVNRKLDISGGVEFKDILTSPARSFAGSWWFAPAFDSVNLLTGTGDLTFSGNGAVQLSSNNNAIFSNDIAVTGTNNWLGLAYTWTFSGDITAALGSELTFGWNDRSNNNNTVTFSGAMDAMQGTLYLASQGGSLPQEFFALTGNAANLSNGAVVLALMGDNDTIAARAVTLQATASGTYRIGELSTENIATGGATLRATDAAIVRSTAAAPVTFAIGSGVFDGHLTNNGTANNGVITDTGIYPVSLDKVGDGTLTLTNLNTYTGTTTVSGGVLLLSGNGNLANTSAVTVSGGTLQLTDSGTINSTVNVEQDGVLLVDTAYEWTRMINLNAGGVLGGNGTIDTWDIEFATADAGVTGGGLGTTGTLTFNELQIWGDFTYYFDIFSNADRDRLIFADGLDLENSNQYILQVNNLGGLTEFSNVSILSGQLDHYDETKWQLGEGFSLDYYGNELYLSYSIPEPSTWLLLGTGVALLAFLRRRR
ncbi:MAG: autotransporter-associated beta strand repeat-containing protein [Verrucomicrobiales bacterium]|jgi:autotransporter-associated beta strand protein|nr:autotransporter-associated beta strand repeat-containing protein [Verrucomicrobiales bacterium]